MLILQKKKKPRHLNTEEHVNIEAMSIELKHITSQHVGAFRSEEGSKKIAQFEVVRNSPPPLFSNKRVLFKPLLVVHRVSRSLRATTRENVCLPFRS